MFLPMKTHIIVTLIGPDRTGLVDALSSAIASHGANWLDSRMSRLCGHFAGILHVEVDSDKQHDLDQALLAIDGLDVTIEAMDSCPVPDAHRILHLEVIGNDRPGIVKDVSQVIASLGVNVEEPETELSSAPMSGEDLFKATARLAVPEETPVDALNDALEALGDDFLVTLTQIVR